MKRPAMEMLTRSRKEMALMANIQKMRSQRMGIGTYNDTRRRPRDLDSCAKNLLTGAAVDATFEACCCFCSMGCAGKDSQPPRTANDGHSCIAGGGPPLPRSTPSCRTGPATRRCAPSCACWRRRGHVRHEEQALRYVYLPTVPRDRARQSDLRHLLATFFDNSSEQAITALLNLKGGGLAPDKLDRLSALIEKAVQFVGSQ